MSGKISYNSEIALRSKRVKFEPTTATDTLKAGYVVCYNNDRTTDMNGTTVALGTLNPARFLSVEKPKTANLNFVAGIVAPSGEGATDGDWVDIYELNGADVQVYTDQACVNGTTTLAVTDGSYLVTAAGASNVNLGLAKDTIDRSGAGDNGFCLMRSYTPLAAASGYTAISAALSNVTSLVSVLSAEDISDVSNMASANSVAIASVLTRALSITSDMTASINTMVDSMHSDMTASINTQIDSAISDVNAVIDSAISDVVATAVAETASLATAITTAAGVASDLTSAAKESCFSHISSLEVNLSDAMSTMTASINTQIDSAVSDLNATIDSAISDVVATNTSTNLSLATQLLSDIASLATMVDSAISDVVATNTSTNLSLGTQLLSDIASIATMVDSAISDVNAVIDSAISDVVATNTSTNLSLATQLLSDIASIDTMVDSAVSDLVATNTSTNLSLATQLLSDIASLATMVDSAISDVVATAVTETASIAKAASDAYSLASNANSAVDGLGNDATSVLASGAITSTASLHIHYTKITLADGTSFSCVANVTSAS